MTKRTRSLFTLFFGILFALSMQCAFAGESLNAVAAVVNNQIITKTELNNAIKSAKQQLAASANPKAINDVNLQKMVLQQLIDEKLQLEIAKQAKLTVTDAQVNQAIAHIAQANGVNVSQLKAKLTQAGMSYAGYRKMIQKQILMHEVQQRAVAGKVQQVTHADLEKALAMYQAQSNTQKQYHVIDIVLPTKQEAEQVMVQLKNGTDISKVSPKNTTDLGWQTQNTLPTLFLQQLASMKQGDVAGPIQAPNGYHVIQLAGAHGQTNSPSKTQLQQIANQIQFQKAVKKWTESLRKSAYIKITE